MCELYYLDQYRAAVVEAEVTDKIKAVVNAEKVSEAEELMREAKISMKAMSERTAKLALDLAFLQIQSVHNDGAAKERLVRYAGELCCKARNEFDVQ